MFDTFILVLINIGNGRNNLLKDIITKIVMQKAINNSNLLVFISNAVKNTFENNFKINKEKAIVVYNGISNKFFEIDKRKVQNQNKNYNIIYVGRLEKVKGISILIKAFKKICKIYPNAKLTIVGEGNERKRLEKLANENKNIIFVGRQSDVIRWLDKSSIFVYPSIWEEGFGISVVEAMSRGCIPITFKKGGLVEIITHEKNGYLIENVNEESLSETILKFINLPDVKKQEMRENAIKTANKYTIENTINALKIKYEEMCKNENIK